MLKKGIIQIYTGCGKGKTTAAVGQTVRARGQGLKASFVYFHKDSDKQKSGEMKILKKIGVDIFCFAKKHPYLNKKSSRSCLKVKCTEALDFIRDVLFKKKYDIIVLDEVNIAMRDCFINENELMKLLRNKPKKLELILTGRDAPKKLIEYADLVSKIKKIKHPYDSGMKMRKGIEY